MSRAAVACAVLLTTGLATGAEAARPRVYCNLVQGHHDYEMPDEAVLPGSTQHTRIKSADVATNATHLTAVIRLRTMAPTSPTKAVEGLHVMFWFHPEGAENDGYDLVGTIGRENDFWLQSSQLDHGGFGPVFWYSGTVERVADAVGVVDRKRAEIRMTVPLRAFAEADGGVRPRTKLRGLGAAVAQSWGDFAGSPAPVTGATFHRDGADAPKHVYYPVGAPSCVRVGR